MASHYHCPSTDIHYPGGHSPDPPNRHILIASERLPNTKITVFIYWNFQITFVNASLDPIKSRWWYNRKMYEAWCMMADVSFYMSLSLQPKGFSHVLISSIEWTSHFRICSFSGSVTSLMFLIGGVMSGLKVSLLLFISVIPHWGNKIPSPNYLSI